MRQLTADLLISHEKLLYNVAHQVAMKYQYNDVDELISRGRQILVERACKWSPARGKFSTFATIVLRNDLGDWITRNRKLIPSSVNTNEEGEEQNPLENIAETVWAAARNDALPSRMDDLMMGLKRLGLDVAAMEVIEVCMTTSLGDVFAPDHRAMEKVRTELIKRGWDRRKTHLVFKEIAVLVKVW